MKSFEVSSETPLQCFFLTEEFSSLEELETIGNSLTNCSIHWFLDKSENRIMIPTKDIVRLRKIWNMVGKVQLVLEIGDVRYIGKTVWNNISDLIVQVDRLTDDSFSEEIIRVLSGNIIIFPEPPVSNEFVNGIRLSTKNSKEIIFASAWPISIEKEKAKEFRKVSEWLLKTFYGVSTVDIHFNNITIKYDCSID